MRKFWLIIQHEYTRHVFRWRFLFLLLSPLFALLFFVLVVFVSYSTQFNNAPVGYVDPSQVIAKITFPADLETPIITNEFLPFPDEAAARQALDRKEIQAYFVIPPDFRQTANARLVFYRQPTVSIDAQFNYLLRVNLLADQPPSVLRRVINGPKVNIETSTETRRETINSILQLAIPLGMSGIMIFMVMLCSGYLVQALVEEKENRTIEILATSASPIAILTGKIIGLVLVGLTQLVVWFGAPLGILPLFAAMIPGLSGAINWVSIVLLLVIIILTFFLICTLITLLSVTLAETRDGQMITALAMLPTSVPFLLAETLGVAPSSPLAVGLSLFPLTAANSLAIRIAFAEVPVWQILISAVLLVISTAGTFWLATKAFKRWMLSSGKRLQWRSLFRAVMQKRVSKAPVNDA